LVVCNYYHLTQFMGYKLVS